MIASPATPQAAPARRARGFTLIELMVALAILGVLMLVAVPGFQDAILANKLSGITNSFSSSVQITRSEAIKRNSTPSAPMKMCRSADGANCASSGGWEQGWIIFNDADNDGVLDSTETLVFRQNELAKGFVLTGDSYVITFLGTGLSGASGALAFKACRKSPSVGASDRAVTLALSGRVSISTTATGTCS